ncbi:MAG: GNAT family N-acetyltransferase, partial [Methanoregula sp.]|nr:GNAT family N-acetyltransferase [Methanoregula sp.]
MKQRDYPSPKVTTGIAVPGHRPAGPGLTRYRGRPVRPAIYRSYVTFPGGIVSTVFYLSENSMVFSLTTERLILDDLTGQDLAGLQRVARDPCVMQYVLIWLENDEQVAGFLQHGIEESLRSDRQDYLLAVRVPGTGAFAGFVLLEIDPDQKSTAEVGYILLPEYWKCGYASEILRALLAFGF